MNKLEFNLEYFKDQSDFWMTVNDDLARIESGLRETPKLGAWWPGLEAYFGENESKQVNALVESMGVMLLKGKSAAIEISERLDQVSWLYAKTEADNEQEATAMWAKVNSEPWGTPMGRE